MLRTGITVDCASSGVILRLALQRPLCNLCREVYNETKAEYFLSVFAVALLAEGVDRNVEVPRGCCVTVGRPPRGGRG